MEGGFLAGRDACALFFVLSLLCNPYSCSMTSKSCQRAHIRIFNPPSLEQFSESVSFLGYYGHCAITIHIADILRTAFWTVHLSVLRVADCYFDFQLCATP